MPLIDCTLTLDGHDTITGVQWSNPQLHKAYEEEWKVFAGHTLAELPDFHLDAEQAKIVWRNEVFDYQELLPTRGVRLLLLKREDHRTLLFEHALNALPDGIQIYDRNACLVHINRASCGISGIPAHVDVVGQHLMDLYDLEEEISTTMTCLRTRRPVINRVDSFRTTSGSDISSVNSAYPVFDGQKLVGAVVFDQNLDSINAHIEVLEERKKTIRDKVSLPPTPFRGYHFSDLVGSNRGLTEAVSLARRIARQDCNILLVGETGTGKEIFAQSIHKASDRKKKKFVAINCAAVPDTLIESMFFGTSKGSFTGSVERPGLLEEANGGILFLDELNSMSLGMQSKLLRVIQEGSFRRVGSGRDIRTDVRFISSCNEPPSQLIEENALRKDLFYRLATVTIEIPPPAGQDGRS
ncbi:sigma 54-interacting transcriptional regulator [Desulfovibrio sp. OttesenSCG-928-I05]|nr:sigma 54-interacting transcriptional regulator [Desulfovibrio sp. OttesenSCG-928-I05]